jgi:hypothetical protein
MSAIRDAAAALGARLSRLRPGTIPAPYLAWAIACWILALLTAVAIVVPGLTAGVDAVPAGSSQLIGLFAAPLPIRLLVAAAGAVLTGTLLVVLLIRGRSSRERSAREGSAREGSNGGVARRVAREFALAAAGGFPVLALAADREWVFAGAALVVFALAELAAHRPEVAGESATPGATVLVGALAASTWVVLLMAQFGVANGGAGSWVWLALFGCAAAFAAFGSYYGVARAAESRSQVFRPLFRDDLPVVAVLGIVVVAAVLVALRLTVARDLFPEPDPGLWAPFAEAPISWLHAVLVATLVVVVAARSVRQPLRRSREHGITAALAVVGNAYFALALGVILLGMLVAIVSGGVFLPDPGPVVVAALKFVGVVAIVVVVLFPAFRGTAARALGLITGAYLLPLTLNGLLGQLGVELPAPLAGFPASPVQVALLLVGVALVGALVALAGPRAQPLGRSLLVRLAVVPLVAVHAGWLLPAAWSDLGRVVLVVGVLLALLFFLPKPTVDPAADPTADPARHTLDVLTASGAQLLVLVVFALAIPSFVDDASTVVLGLFWLSVAVIAALTIRTTAVATRLDR